MSEGIEPIYVLVRMWDDDEKRYTLPVDGPQLIADLITWIPDMEQSRAAAIIEGAPIGYVGPFLEIRRMGSAEKTALKAVRVGRTVKTGSVYHAATCGCTVCIPVLIDPDNPDGHEIGCTCLYCIPGA